MKCQCESGMHSHASACPRPAEGAYIVDGFGIRETFTLCGKCRDSYSTVPEITVTQGCTLTREANERKA